jgi:hypothetical protein
MHEEKNIVETGFKLNSQETSHVTREEAPFYKNTDKTFQGTITKPGETLTTSIPASTPKKQQQENSADHEIVSQALKQEENSAIRIGDIKISKKFGVNRWLKELSQAEKNGFNTLTNSLKQVGVNTPLEETPRPGNKNKEEDDLSTEMRKEVEVKNSNKIPLVKITPPTETEIYPSTNHPTYVSRENTIQDLTPKPLIIPEPLIKSQDTSPATLKTLRQEGMTTKPVSPQVQKHNRVDKRKETKRKYRKFKKSKDKCRKKKKDSYVNRVQNKSKKNKTTGTPRKELFQGKGKVMVWPDWTNRTVLGRGRPPEKHP